MPHHSTAFERTDRGLALQSAILLYAPDRASNGFTPAPTKAAAFASIHPVETTTAGVPEIGTGTPLTRAHLRAWADALDRSTRPEILPPNMLVSHRDVMAWWVPAQIRTGYFALTSTDGLEHLTGRKMIKVPYPAHVLIATRRGLNVFALERDARPDPETILLHSPILNIFVSGSLCWGDIAQPQSLTIASIPEYERAVFDSWSTHPNPGQQSTVTGPGGLTKLWDELAGANAKKFPVRRLRAFTFNRGGETAGRKRRKPDPVTLGDLLNKVAR